MSTPPRNLPRFLPTLTEVVHPSSLAKTSAPSMPDLDEIVQTVMQRVEGVFERRLSEEIDAMVRRVVTEQRETLRLRLWQELEIEVWQAVSEAMASRSEAHKSK